MIDVSGLIDVNDRNNLFVEATLYYVQTQIKFITIIAAIN